MFGHLIKSSFLLPFISISFILLFVLFLTRLFSYCFVLTSLFHFCRISSVFRPVLHSKKMIVSWQILKKGFPRIGPFFRVYSLSIRLSLQRTRHTNQSSAHLHLWTKFFPPSLFLWYHTLHQLYYQVEI